MNSDAGKNVAELTHTGSRPVLADGSAALDSNSEINFQNSENRRAENALRSIVEGTASTTAEDFFHSLVRHLACALNVNHAFVGRVCEPGRDKVETLAVWQVDHYAPNSAYSLIGTPSAEIIGSEIRCFPHSVQEHFPEDHHLKLHAIESYMGAPIFDSAGNAVGILGVLDNRPMPDWPAARWILRIFAARAGAELERLTTEREARTLQHQLLQAHKMEAIGQLAAGIAHDLNNSLGAVVGHLQLIKLEGALKPELERSVDVALQGCERAGGLVTQLLGFARKGKYNLTDLNLSEVVDETLEFLARVVGEKVKIIVEGKAEAPVRGDSGQLEQVLTNLIINATHAMPNGGTIQLSFSKAFVANPERFNHHAVSGDYITLAVRDSGSGISEANLEKIFEPFFTTKEEGSGTGLGLSVAYGIMQNHGGWISVESKLGEGTTFTLYLPQISASECVTEDTGRLNVEPREKTVLVIDDEQNLVDLTTTFLARAGMAGHGFSSAANAINWYREHAGSVDLVIMDMKMPGTSGSACFEALRSINPQAKIIILSGYIEDNSVQKLLGKGALRFFQKPLKYPELMDWISELLNTAES